MQQDAVQAKGRASAALQQAQQQQAQASEHLALLKKQLAEERQQEAASSANLDIVQAELARIKTQVVSAAVALDCQERWVVAWVPCKVRVVVTACLQMKC